MAEKSPDYLDPHEYTLEQEWKEEEQVFSVTLKIFYFGKEIFNGGFKDKNFLGIETDSLKRLGEEIISGVNSRLTSEQINTSRQPVSFSVGKGRLKIKDSKGTIYMKYGHFDTNILHLTREPSPLHYLFWERKEEIGSQNPTIDHLKTAGYFFDLCCDLFQSLQSTFKLIQGGEISGIEEERLFDYEFTKLVVHQVNMIRKIIEKSTTLDKPEEENEYVRWHIRTIAKQLDFLNILDPMENHLQSNNIKEFLALARTVGEEDICELRLLSSTRALENYQYPIITFDTDKVISLLTQTNTLADYQSFLDESKEENKLDSGVLPTMFWRRLRCHNLLPKINTVISKIILANTPLKTYTTTRIYPLLGGRHLDVTEEDKSIPIMVKEAKFNNRRYDFKFDSGILSVRESAISIPGMTVPGNWRKASSVSNTVSSKKAIELLPENPYLLMIHSKNNTYIKQMTVLVSDGLNHKMEDNEPVGIWYETVTKYNFSEYIGKTTTDDLILLTSGEDNENQYLSFLKRNDADYTFQEVHCGNVTNLFPVRKEIKVDKNMEGRIGKSNLFFVCDNLLLGVHQPDILETSTVYYRDLHLFKYTMNNTNQSQATTPVVDLLSGSGPVKLEQLHVLQSEEPIVMGRDSPYDEDSIHHCRFFRYSKSVYLYLSCSQVSKKIHVFACVISPRVNIFRVESLTTSLTSRLMHDYKFTSFDIKAGWDAKRKVLTMAKVDARISRPVRLYFFKLE